MISKPLSILILHIDMAYTNNNGVSEKIFQYLWWSDYGDSIFFTIYYHIHFTVVSGLDVRLEPPWSTSFERNIRRDPCQGAESGDTDLYKWENPFIKQSEQISAFKVSNGWTGSPTYPRIPVLVWWQPFTGDDGIQTCGKHQCFVTNDRAYRNHPMLR